MNLATYNYPERKQEYLNDHLGPNCETIKSKECGAGTIKLVKANDLYGILISGGQLDEQRLKAIMEKWKARFGDSIQRYEGPDQYKFILQQYFNNAFESRDHQEATAYNKLGPANTGVRKPQMNASMQPLSGATQENHYKRRASDSKKQNDQAKKKYDSETDEITADTEQKIGECHQQGQNAANQTNSEIDNLHSQIGCQKICKHVESEIQAEFARKGVKCPDTLTPLGELKITSLEEFDKWFPGLRGGGTWLSGDYLASDQFILVYKHNKYYLVHQESGVTLLGGAFSELDFHVLSQIGGTLEGAATREAETEAAKQGILDEAKEKAKAADDKRKAAEEKFKKDMEKYQTIKQIREKHLQVAEALYNIEVLAKNLGFHNVNRAATGGKHANELCMNLRFIYESLGIEKLKEAGSVQDFINTLVTGGSLTLLSGVLGAAAAYTQIIAMMKPHETDQALLTSDFYKVVNNHLTPLFREINKSINDLANHSKNQSDRLRADILQSMSEGHKSLLQSIKNQTDLIDKQSSISACQEMIRQLDGKVDAYYEKARKASEYIDGTRSSSSDWFWNYYQDTKEAVNLSGGLVLNGHNGREFAYDIETAAESPLYCSPIIHQSVFNRNNFASNLGVLYTATHTFILLAKRLLEKEAYDGRSNDDIARRRYSLELAQVLVNGVNEQNELFGQMDAQLDSLIQSYREFTDSVTANKALADRLKQNKYTSAKIWAERDREMILNSLVGRKMFYLDKFIHEPITAKEFNKEFDDIIWTREGARDLGRKLLNPINHRKMAYEKTKNVSIKTLCDTNKIDMPEHWTDTNNWKRRIWSQDGTQFGNSLAIQTHPVYKVWEGFSIGIPLAAALGQFDDVPVGGDDASNIHNPLLDCTVTYIGANNGLEVKFDNNSRLQKDDVNSIKWSGESATDRRQMFEEILSIFSDTPVNDMIAALKNSTEVCLSVNNKLPPIALPKNLMSYMQKFLCPEAENMTLLGHDFDLKYDFVKTNDTYQLKIHAVLNNRAFISCVVSEFDSVTVDAFQNPVEFLYCALFALRENDGITGNLTHHNPKNGLIAPVLESFPGLISILERNPHRCFSFNHKNYSAQVATRDVAALSNRAEFFKKGEVHLEREVFAEAQNFINKKKNDVKKSTEFKNFKKRYNTFVALAALATNKEAQELKTMLSTTVGIEQPDNPHAMEFAAFFVSPTDENKQHIKDTLGALESPAKSAMKADKEKLDKIITFLNRVTDAPLNRISKSEHELLAVELGLGLGERPESRSRLMEDTFRTA